MCPTKKKKCPDNIIHEWRGGLTISSHWCTATATCVPSGLVNTNTSPGTALSGLVTVKHHQGLLHYNKIIHFWWKSEWRKSSRVNMQLEVNSHMINSLGWQTVVATPPITTQGLSTVCPPVTDVPASSDASLNPWMISGITLSLSCKDPGNSEQRQGTQCNTTTTTTTTNINNNTFCSEHN